MGSIYLSVELIYLLIDGNVLIFLRLMVLMLWLAEGFTLPLLQKLVLKSRHFMRVSSRISTMMLCNYDCLSLFLKFAFKIARFSRFNHFFIARGLIWMFLRYVSTEFLVRIEGVIAVNALVSTLLFYRLWFFFVLSCFFVEVDFFYKL